MLGVLSQKERGRQTMTSLPLPVAHATAHGADVAAQWGHTTS